MNNNTLFLFCALATSSLLTPNLMAINNKKKQSRAIFKHRNESNVINFNQEEVWQALIKATERNDLNTVSRILKTCFNHGKASLAFACLGNLLIYAAENNYNNVIEFLLQNPSIDQLSPIYLSTAFNLLRLQKNESAAKIFLYTVNHEKLK